MRGAKYKLGKSRLKSADSESALRSTLTELGTQDRLKRQNESGLNEMAVFSTGYY